MPNWSIGRTGQVYVASESAYATAPSFVATNAFRHLNVNLHFNPYQPFKSPERHTHPSQLQLFQRRQQATVSLKAQWYPSGTLNTVPESDPLLQNAIGGASSNIVLSTTCSSGFATTGATVASATGLAVNQFIQFTYASGVRSGQTYALFLTGVAGAVLTWSPALPLAPTAGDTVKGCITYAPATAFQKSVDIAHYPQLPSQWKNREMLGWAVNKITWDFDSNLEPMILFDGPAQGFAGSAPTWTAQAQPGSFTTVGAESAIPSGLFGNFFFNGTLYQIVKAQIIWDNTFDLQNNAYGTQKAVAAYRKNKRAVTAKVTAMVSDDLTLWTPAATLLNTNTFLLQEGQTPSKIWALYAPNAQIVTIPDTPDADETNQHVFDVTFLGTSGNDELFVGAL